MRPLVVLRPEPGASATCAAARAMGLEAVSVPLFEIQPVAWAAPDRVAFDGLLLTSASALRTGGPELARLRGLPAFAVGEATASEAQARGFALASAGSGGVDELLEQIDPGLRLLHLCGEQWREPNAPRQAITHLPVYRAAELPSPDLSPCAGAVVAVHSPRAGERLSELIARSSLDSSAIALAAISLDTARACGGGWERVEAAGEPGDGALLALAARLCNSPAR